MTCSKSHGWQAVEPAFQGCPTLKPSPLHSSLPPIWPSLFSCFLTWPVANKVGRLPFRMHIGFSLNYGPYQCQSPRRIWPQEGGFRCCPKSDFQLSSIDWNGLTCGPWKSPWKCIYSQLSIAVKQTVPLLVGFTQPIMHPYYSVESNLGGAFLDGFSTGLLWGQSRSYTHLAAVWAGWFKMLLK